MRKQLMQLHIERQKSKTRRIASSLLASSLLGLAAVTAVWSVAADAPLAHAQNFGQRTIEGLVYNSEGKTADGATVFLKNLKTHNVHSFTTQNGGVFRFAQVGMVDDYEVWAEHTKAKSAVKTISSFDSRKEMHIELKLK